MKDAGTLVPAHSVGELAEDVSNLEEIYSEVENN
jgi:hypothetical protein